MRHATSGGSHGRPIASTGPATDLKQLAILAQRIRHTARLAAMALGGNDPGMGIDYLRDALEMLETELRPPPRRPRARAAV